MTKNLRCCTLDRPEPLPGGASDRTRDEWQTVAPGTPPALALLYVCAYHLAFEHARAVARPSWVERDLLAVWN